MYTELHLSEREKRQIIEDAKREKLPVCECGAVMNADTDVVEYWGSLSEVTEYTCAECGCVFLR